MVVPAPRAALIFLCLIVGSFTPARGKELSMDDARLSQPLQLSVAAEPLGDLLGQVEEQTGIRLAADPPMSDTVLTCHYKGTVRQWMETVAAYLGADREHPALWTRSGAAKARHYQLERDLVTVAAIRSLREEREQRLFHRMAGLFRSRRYTTEQWQQFSRRDPEGAKSTRAALEVTRENEVLHAMGELPPEAQQTILRGGQVRLSVAELAGKRSPLDYLKRLLGDTYRFTGQGTITYYSLGTSPFQRVIYTRFGEDPGSPGMELGVFIGISDLFPDTTGARLQAEWRRAFGDPALPTEALVRLRDKHQTPKGGDRRAELLLRLAMAAGVNLIADDMGQVMDGTALPAEGRLSDLLDRLCRCEERPVHMEDVDGAFWRMRGDTYLVRSLSWPEDELLLIPHRWLAAWRASERRNGHLLMQDAVEMAALHPRQLQQLATWFPQAKEIARLQAPLRWFARASPAVKARLQQRDGVSLAELGVGVDSLREDSPPEEEEKPVYVELLRGASPAEVQVNIGEGGQMPNPQKWAPIVGVVFRCPRLPQANPVVLIAHLKRD